MQLRYSETLVNSIIGAFIVVNSLDLLTWKSKEPKSSSKRMHMPVVSLLDQVKTLGIFIIQEDLLFYFRILFHK